ncbi:uncharacterized protein EI97DRAFT_218285 [Westerdykella ornata]|uniref:Uncharacterized protein n=1 Tax=Westerdykella ornata TaxID=318751 RepID=A0A6A6JSP0_WESOR|nr:uncharacterized protein EI97DRAFT_218285 [Westerdykella ornata]KAF2278756.1 hypothetical protein EI97DRAFT_218285 [Westerdykella ornata]
MLIMFPNRVSVIFGWRYSFPDTGVWLQDFVLSPTSYTMSIIQTSFLFSVDFLVTAGVDLCEGFALIPILHRSYQTQKLGASLVNGPSQDINHLSPPTASFLPSSYLTPTLTQPPFHRVPVAQPREAVLPTKVSIDHRLLRTSHLLFDIISAPAAFPSSSLICPRSGAAMTRFTNGTPAPAIVRYVAPNGAATGGPGSLPSGQSGLGGRLTPASPSTSSGPQARGLPRSVKAAMGDQKNTHTRCINCWRPRGHGHQDWWACRSLCPRCPEDQQHYSQACPLLLDETNDEWWIAHAGCPKPEWRGRDRRARFARAPRTISPIATSSRGHGNQRNANGLRGGEARGENAILSAHLRGGGNTYGPARTRSRSPERERVVEYRARNDVLPPRRPERVSPPAGGQPSLSQQVQVGQTVNSGAEASVVFEYRARDAVLPPRRQDPVPPTTGGQSSLAPQVQVDRTVNSGAEALAAREHNGLGGTYNNSIGATHYESGSPDTLRPTAVIWSDGSTTEPSVRDLLMHDPWMTMLVHQTVMLADFFDRHPDASRGEQLVSDGMARYLADIRREFPAYLSPSRSGNGSGNSSNGGVTNATPETDREAGEQ